MGSWSVTCAATGTFIHEGEQCVVIPLITNTSNTDFGSSYMRTSDVYIPCGFPILGDYDTYGGIDTVEDTINHRINMLFFGRDDYVDGFGNLDLKTQKGSIVYTMFINRKIWDLFKSWKGTFHSGDWLNDDIEKGKTLVEKQFKEYWQMQELTRKVPALAEFRELHWYDSKHSSISEALGGMAKFDFLDEEYCNFLNNLALSYCKEKDLESLIKLVNPVNELYMFSYVLKFICNRPFMQNMSSTQYPEGYLLEKQNKLYKFLIKLNNKELKAEAEFNKEFE